MCIYIYVYIYIYTHTVSHRSEYTPHIFVNILLLSRLADPNKQEDEGYSETSIFTNINDNTGTDHSLNQINLKTRQGLEQNWMLIKEQEQKSKRDD